MLLHLKKSMAMMMVMMVMMMMMMMTMMMLKDIGQSRRCRQFSSDHKCGTRFELTNPLA